MGVAEVSKRAAAALVVITCTGIAAATRAQAVPDAPPAVPASPEPPAAEAPPVVPEPAVAVPIESPPPTATPPPAVQAPPASPPDAPDAQAPAVGESAAPAQPAPPLPADPEPVATPEVSPPPAVAAQSPIETRETQAPFTRSAVDARGGYTGFSFRLDAGGGYGGTTRELSTAQQRLRGLAGYVGVDLGSAIGANLILSGHLAGLAFNHSSSDDSADAGSGYVALVGPGLRYHFMPRDWYAGGALDLAVMAVTDATGEVQNSRVGYGVELELGKVWSASYGQSAWNVGLGIRATYALCPASRTIPEPEEPWTVMALNGIFSVGYD